MTGMIFALKRFAVHDGDGVRTTVFLKGCPLRCRWCHNPEGLKAEPQIAFYAHKCVSCGACTAVCPNGAQDAFPRYFNHDRCTACGKCVSVCPAEALELFGESVTPESLLPKLLEDRDFYKESGGGVTLSGGECLLQADFCAELLRLLTAEGIHPAVDTCGFVPWESIENVLPYTDLFLYDVKEISEAGHLADTGRSNVLILDNLRKLCAAGAQIEVRIPYIPEHNDGQIDSFGAFLQECGTIRSVRLLPSHDYARTKYMALGMFGELHALPKYLPTDEELDEARQRLREWGLCVLDP